MNFSYIPTNVAGPGCNLADFNAELPGCECDNEKCEDDCTCLRFGRVYDCENSSLILLDTKKLSSEEDNPIFECGPTCRCGPSCGNRVAQFGIQVPLEVFETQNTGCGLRTLTNLKRGQFVCEYAGEVIDLAEASNRFSSMHDGDPNYIFVLREYSDHSESRVEIDTCIDPTRFGNLGRFINHSCQPNLAVIPVRYDSVIPHLCFFANRDIECGEELCYDYAGSGESDLSTKVCYCKAKNCRGFLPLDKRLLEIASDVS